MGSIVEYMKMAVQNIMAKKGRSFLTMLGIIIGIASVIMIISVGDGTTAEMNKTMDSVGGGQIYIMCSDEAMVAGQYLTAEDVEAVRNGIDGVLGVNAGNSMSGDIVTGKGDFTVSMNGSTQDGFALSNLDLKYGKSFDTADINEARRICLISDSDAKRLYGSDDVVGMDLDITADGISKTYRIVGVTTQNESVSMIQFNYGDSPITLTVPFTALADYMESYDKFFNMMVQADKTMDSTEISKRVVKLLESRHQAAGEEYYRVQSFQDIMQQMNSILGIMTAFISFVAGISLLVGGIGVMNIMLVSVTERTREIGIRKSLGARTSSIMMQFLAESAIITAIGGVIGIILGLAGAFGICAIITQMGTRITPGIKISTILIATVFSCAVGIFFGIYPARKAAKLSPMEALRRS